MASGNSLEISNDVLLQTVECPVCLEIPTPPIVQCQTGHFICSVCRQKMTRCGICQADFTNTRNFAIESLVARIGLHQCKNEMCAKMLSPSNIDQHMETCEFR